MFKAPPLESNEFTKEDLLARYLIARMPVYEVFLRKISNLEEKFLTKVEMDEVYLQFRSMAIGKPYEEFLKLLAGNYPQYQSEEMFTEDGVSHINVWSKGRTELGRLLSNFAHTPFDHPEYGHFESVEAFWYWLSTGKRHEQLRPLYGFEAKAEGKNLPREKVDGFEAIIKKAILCKVDQNPHLAKLLKESSLPLMHYYVYGDETTPSSMIRHHPHKFDWIVDYLETVRLYLQGKAHKLIVAGSRSIEDYDVVEAAIFSSGFVPVEIVCGMARGVDRKGLEFARDRKLPIEKMPANWDNPDGTKNKSAGYERNVRMAEYGTAGVIVWDGESSGSIHMAMSLRKCNKFSQIYNSEGYRFFAEGEVFVFGSNLHGLHGSGAAKTAHMLFGAVWGKGVGFHGNSYAIPTRELVGKSEDGKPLFKTLPLETIRRYVEGFVAFTKTSGLKFRVSGVGTGRAGIPTTAMAPLFNGAVNCKFPSDWYGLVA